MLMKSGVKFRINLLLTKAPARVKVLKSIIVLYLCCKDTKLGFYIKHCFELQSVSYYYYLVYNFGCSRHSCIQCYFFLFRSRSPVVISRISSAVLFWRQLSAQNWILRKTRSESSTKKCRKFRKFFSERSS